MGEQVTCWRCKRSVPESETVCYPGVGTQCRDTESCRVQSARLRYVHPADHTQVVERLRAELEQVRTERDAAERVAEERRERAKAAEARAKRYRAALEETRLVLGTYVYEGRGPEEIVRLDALVRGVLEEDGDG